MSTDCYPITVLPHLSALFQAFLETDEGAPVRRWYGGGAMPGAWRGGASQGADRRRLADALERQSLDFCAGSAALANIAKLRTGARAVVTGQQVGLFGGPLLTLLKAATAVARARQATAATGLDHVPIFWLATEDHDLAEVDHLSLPSKHAVETLRAELSAHGRPVGTLELGAGAEAALTQAEDLLGHAPICELLRECYAPRPGYAPTLGGAFARLMARLFTEQGLIVMDAAGRDFHTLGAPTLRAAIERAEEMHEALQARSAELEAAGFHAQVLVAPGSSLLFLVEEATGERQALKRTPDGAWKAGRRVYSTAELLGILETAPERVSPNALLRPVFQDTMLPTAAYIGGPAEIAYFAQSAVLYERILGRIPSVLPRLSATLIEPAIAAVMDRHELSLAEAFTTPQALAQRLGARAMPIAGKRKLAAVGNAMDAELTALTEYLSSMDESLGRSAAISGNKMRYQMNRLRRMAATFELQKEASLRKHAVAMTLNLFPGGHPQERVLGAVWFLARAGDGLIARLVAEAENVCPGHMLVRL